MQIIVSIILLLAIRKGDGDHILQPCLLPTHLFFSHCIFALIFVMFSLLLSLWYVVHGFEKASDNVIEGDNLFITFSLNVKGETTLLGAVTGEITSRAGGTSRKLLFYDHQCEMLHTKLDLLMCADALLEQDESETQIRH